MAEGQTSKTEIIIGRHRNPLPGLWIVSYIIVLSMMRLLMVHVTAVYRRSVTARQDTLSLLKIEDLRDRVPYQLSGGEKKKVAFASIMVTNPDVYILDEPFNNLSKEYEEFFRELLHELHSAGKTIIMSAHHFKHLHHEKADVLLFEDGKADSSCPGDAQNQQYLDPT
ncbi:ABC transporter ATP-binding protein, partial [Streptococcus thermophilus CNCM I-1630]